MAFSPFGLAAVLLELLRPFLWLILALALAEATALFLLWRRGNNAWKSGLQPAIFLGALVMVIAVFAGPWLTSAGFSDLVGLLDWFALLAGSLAAGLLAALLFWPLVTLAKGRVS